MEKYSFYWGIPSYGRVDKQAMLLYLAEMGYKREQIILSTQTLTDYEEYKGKYEDLATIIYREGHNVSENKNTILEYIRDNCENTRVVICSDKVKAINVMDRAGRLTEICTRSGMEHFIKSAFYVAGMTKAQIWGVAPIKNTFYMEKSISSNLFLRGCCMGLTDPANQMFDVDQPLKEDWEIGLRIIASGGRTIRFNDICLTYGARGKGGCYKDWHSEGDIVNEQCTQRLLAMYPDLVKPHASRKNELRYIGKSKKIQHSVTDF